MNVLQINSSANQKNSISRYMVNQITEKLRIQTPFISVKDRDVAYDNLPYLDQTFIEGMFNKGLLNEAQQNALKLSDELIEELKQSDTLIIGAPMYNFTVPSSLKSYFDLIARPGKTFQFNSRGEMKGLLMDKTAFVVISSGGTPIGGAQDHSASYIKTFLNFIGIINIHFINMDQSGLNFEGKAKATMNKIEAIVNGQELN